MILKSGNNILKNGSKFLTSGISPYGLSGLVGNWDASRLGASYTAGDNVTSIPDLVSSNNLSRTRTGTSVSGIYGVAANGLPFVEVENNTSNATYYDSSLGYSGYSEYTLIGVIAKQDWSSTQLLICNGLLDNSGNYLSDIRTGNKLMTLSGYNQTSLNPLTSISGLANEDSVMGIHSVNYIGKMLHHHGSKKYYQQSITTSFTTPSVKIKIANAQSVTIKWNWNETILFNRALTEIECEEIFQFMRKKWLLKQ